MLTGNEQHFRFLYRSSLLITVAGDWKGAATARDVSKVSTSRRVVSGLSLCTDLCPGTRLLCKTPQARRWEINSGWGTVKFHLPLSSVAAQTKSKSEAIPASALSTCQRV
jgi:hypothetical protein